MRNGDIGIFATLIEKVKVLTPSLTIAQDPMVNDGGQGSEASGCNVIGETMLEGDR
jgi:hypothetical protein